MEPYQKWNVMSLAVCKKNGRINFPISTRPAMIFSAFEIVRSWNGGIIISQEDTYLGDNYHERVVLPRKITGWDDNDDTDNDDDIGDEIHWHVICIFPFKNDWERKKKHYQGVMVATNDA